LALVGSAAPRLALEQLPQLMKDGGEQALPLVHEGALAM
jgi:hypothetical protein